MIEIAGHIVIAFIAFVIGLFLTVVPTYYILFGSNDNDDNIFSGISIFIGGLVLFGGVVLMGWVVLT